MVLDSQVIDKETLKVKLDEKSGGRLQGNIAII